MKRPHLGYHRENPPGVLPSDHKKNTKDWPFLALPLGFIINQEDLIKFGRAGGNATNRETLDLIRRVVTSGKTQITNSMTIGPFKVSDAVLT